MTELERSYFIELEVVDDPVSGFAEITGRLYDEEGGRQVTEVSLIDTGWGGVPAYTLGTAEAWALTWGDNPLNGTLDNIRAEALVQAQEWDGGVGDWADSNWSGGNPPIVGGRMIIDAPTADSDVTYSGVPAGSAGSLAIGDNFAAVLRIPSATLGVDSSVAVGAHGTLQIGPNGTLNAGGDLTMQEASQYTSQLGAVDHGLIELGGNANLGGTLGAEAISKLNQAPPGELEWYGDQTRTILTAANVIGTFTQEPPTVPDEPVLGGPNDNWGQRHLGRGVFLTDDGPHGQGVIYEPGAVKLDLFQAADGDTNGDRTLDGLDLQAILAAQTFGTGAPADWPTGDFTDGVNGDSAGVTDGEDLQAILATGLWGTPQPYAAVDPGDGGDGVVDLILDPSSGGLSLSTDGVLINGYVIKSADGIFTGEPAQNLGAFQIDNDQEISGNFFFTLDGEHFFGNVIGQEWEMLTKGGGVNPFEDLTFTYTRVDMPGTFFGNLIVIPEPGTFALAAVAAVALLAAACWRRLKGAV